VSGSGPARGGVRNLTVPRCPEAGIPLGRVRRSAIAALGGAGGTVLVNRNRVGIRCDSGTLERMPDVGRQKAPWSG
jgi:hypothetical protein